MLKKLLSPVCALAVAGSAGSANAQVLLDDFSMATDIWPIALSDDAPMFTATEFNGTGVGELFSRRITEGEFESADIVEIDDAEVGIFATPGLLDYSSVSGAEARFTLTYDGTVGTGIGEVLDGLDSVVISLADFDAANDGMLITVGVVFADASSADGFEMVNIAGAQDVEIPIAFGGSEVESISILFEPDKGTDFRLDDIRIVPEPATALILAMGGLLALRRR